MDKLRIDGQIKTILNQDDVQFASLTI